MADAKELEANLVNYRAQLGQVEAALTTDPENEELKKLKQDLEEVISLTQDLLKVNERGASEAPGPETVRWKAGEKCQAVWSQDGNYYDAVIERISDDHITCTVTFGDLGNTEIVMIASLRDPEKIAGKKRSFKEAEGTQSTGSSKTRAEKDKTREQKRKKMQKKAQKLKEIEEQREQEKNKWLSFFNNSKGSGSSKGRSLKGVSKKSIFASPETINGKVGVGTCGIGGQPMTQFSTPDKVVYKK